MKILTTSTDAQIIKIIPRNAYSSMTLEIRDESTNTSTSYAISGTPSYDGDYFQLSNSYSLVEGRYYNLTLKDGSGNILYKDKIFCTDQTVNESTNDYYTVNSGEYTSDASFDNDYIIV